MRLQRIWEEARRAFGHHVKLRLLSYTVYGIPYAPEGVPESDFHLYCNVCDEIAFIATHENHQWKISYNFTKMGVPA